MIAAGWLIPAVLLAVLLTLVGCVLASGAMHREDTARADRLATRLAAMSGLVHGLLDSGHLADNAALTVLAHREAALADLLLRLPDGFAEAAADDWHGRHVRVLP